MGGGISLALVGEEGAALLAKLHGQCFAEGWSAEAMAVLLAGPRTEGLVALEDQVPVGMLLYRLAADEAEVITLGVAHGCRERGLGRRLLEAGLGAMAGAGAAMCFLEVALGNEAALALYRSSGFREVGRRPGYYREGGRLLDALVLRRDLTP